MKKGRCIMEKFHSRAIYTAALIIVLCFVGVFVFKSSFIGNKITGQDDFSEGWTYEDGTPVDLYNLHFIGEDGRIIIKKSISSDELQERTLAFTSNNLIFDIYLGSTEIYDFHPGLTGLVGKSYGKYRHYVHYGYGPVSS